MFFRQMIVSVRGILEGLSGARMVLLLCMFNLNTHFHCFNAVRAGPFLARWGPGGVRSSH